MKEHKQHNGFPWKKVLFALLALGLLGIGAVLIWASFIKLPDISTFEARQIANSSKITDRTGQIVLYDAHQSVKRTQIPLASMGDPIQKAVISIEDQDFYHNSGIRPTSILRAVFVNIIHVGYVQGGSTITQQIIKNTLLNGDKSVARKLKEWVLAVRLTRQFSKDQILEIYLNDAPLGGTVYGVEQASQSYFGIPAAQLDLAQAAYIAAMLPAPTYYSPFGSHKKDLDSRKNLVLSKMKQYGYITSDQMAAAKTEVVAFNQASNTGVKAPHFVFYILDQLEQKYGKDVLDNDGYTIKTTLDYDLQQKAEQIVATQVAANEKQYNASNSSLVAIDPTTGQILTMVGSRNYFDKQIDGAYNTATAQRQPGSSFKPFVYATAFAKGYTPETVVFDVPTEFSTNCTPDQQPLAGFTSKDCYNPANFDNKFKGPISLRSAIAESRNVPSVKLLYLVGVQNAVDFAHALGITTLTNPAEIGLSLVLGGGEVKLLDMTSAYGVFANSGVRNPTTGILEVDDNNGNILEQYQPNPTSVMDKNVALTMNNVLSDAQARIPTFGTTLITIPGVAVKTGTTNSDRDAWTVGYTPSISIGVWSGNNDNKPMKSGGSAISGPTWKMFMQYTLTKYPNTAFEEPVPDPDANTLKPILRGIWIGNETVKVDKVTGLRATDTTPADATTEKVITDVHDILYWVNKSDPHGPIPTNPSSDPQFHLWEPSVQTWWANNAGKYNSVSSADIPASYDTAGTAGTTSPLSLSGISDTMNLNDNAEISVTTSAQYPLTSVDVLIDNSYVATLPAPFHFVFTPSDYNLKIGPHTITFNATNSVYGKSTITKNITFVQGT
ncbi:MAG: PBP1A family penicillin-binding protein [Candidatus Paceibacterota bacterium]